MLPTGPLRDAHRHVGALPPYGFYGLPPFDPAPGPASVDQVLAAMDTEGTERALVIPNYGVPDPAVSFGFNELVVAAAGRDDRVRACLWTSPLERDAERTDAALSLAGEPGVRALKLSFLLGGQADDPACEPGLEKIFGVARERGLVVHVHTSPGAASDVDHVGALVDRFGADVAIHLVHFGGGVSGHMKLAGGRFFDWVEAGKRVYTDVSWAVGFAPRFLAAEIERRGIGHDRLLFASDEPWGDHPGELARVASAVGDGELGRAVMGGTWDLLYG